MHCEVDAVERNGAPLGEQHQNVLVHRVIGEVAEDSLDIRLRLTVPNEASLRAVEMFCVARSLDAATAAKLVITQPRVVPWPTRAALLPGFERLLRGVPRGQRVAVLVAEEHPDGTERLYADGQFWAQPDYCEAYGKDLITGAPLEPTEYRAMNPHGKAIIKAAEYVPPHERPSRDYPFVLITGRTLYHFHTRTKTGRAPQLNAAAAGVGGSVAH